jgi:hypothetical protein
MPTNRRPIHRHRRGLSFFEEMSLQYSKAHHHRPGFESDEERRRDICISFMVKEAMQRWQLKRKQAAYMVAIVLTRRGIKPASTRQVLDIYDNRDSLGARVVDFMMAAVPDDPDDPPSDPGAGAI